MTIYLLFLQINSQISKDVVKFADYEMSRCVKRSSFVAFMVHRKCQANARRA